MVYETCYQYICAVSSFFKIEMKNGIEKEQKKLSYCGLVL